MGFFEDAGSFWSNNIAPISTTIAATAVGGPAAGMAAGSYWNQKAQNKANEQNIALTREQMDFQRDMSNTAHQRETQDLIKAGLNPTLSAGGNGSSTPSGAAATVNPTTIAMPDLMSYGISLKQIEQADQRIAIEKANSAASIAKTLSEKDLNKMKQILAQKGMLRAEAEGEVAKWFTDAMKKWKKLKDDIRKPNLKNIETGQMPYIPNL